MKTEFDLRFERAKKEIEEEIKNGLLPNTVKNLNEIDQYADCHYFGGFTDEGYEISENYELENQVQEAINQWLETR